MVELRMKIFEIGNKVFWSKIMRIFDHDVRDFDRNHWNLHWKCCILFSQKNKYVAENQNDFYLNLKNLRRKHNGFYHNILVYKSHKFQSKYYFCVQLLNILFQIWMRAVEIQILDQISGTFVISESSKMQKKSFAK